MFQIQQDDNMEYGGVLRVTGTCYFTAFTIFDADITKTAYYDYDSNTKLLHTLTIN